MREWESGSKPALVLLTFPPAHFPTFTAERNTAGCYEEIKRAGSVIALPAHAISIKNKHLLVIYSIPARGFTAAVSVFRGTPPPKPFDCKICKSRLARVLVSGGRVRSWTHHTGDDAKLVLAIFGFAPDDIIQMSLRFRSQTVFAFLHALRFVRQCLGGFPPRRAFAGKQKTLLAHGKQGVEILVLFVTCLPPDYPSSIRAVARHTQRIASG